MGAPAAIVLSCACLAPLAQEPDASTARFRSPAITGVPVAVGVDGVLVRTSESAMSVVGWQDVGMTEGAIATEAAAFRELADHAWRGRSRLARGDAAGAEPLFESVFPRIAGRGGPTAGLVSSGLARCAVRRGAHASAVGAWLAWVASDTPIETSGWLLDAPDSPEAAPPVDPGTGLVPDLPPVFVNTPAVQALSHADLLRLVDAKAGDWTPAVAEPPAPRSTAVAAKAARLAALYHEAAAFEAGGTVIEGEWRSAEPGLGIVGEVVAARCASATAREQARAALAERLKKHPAPWMEAWCRVGVGRSLLRESDEESRLLGVAELLQVPARLGDVVPYLTGVALAESARALWERGDTAGALKLKSELVERCPQHPVLEWEPLREMQTTGAAKPAPASNAGGS